jgi:hypothetical protein
VPVSAASIDILTGASTEVPGYMHGCAVRNDMEVTVSLEACIFRLQGGPWTLLGNKATHFTNRARVAHAPCCRTQFPCSLHRADLEKLDFDFDLELPMLYTVAEYDVSGRILLIPIKGNGPLYGNWSKFSTVHLLLQRKE